MRRTQIIQSTIVFLLILLFAYTGFSKLLSYNQTRGTLAAVEIIGGKAGFVAWFVPLVELLTALLLSTNKGRKLGLYMSTILMTVFTIYVFYVARSSEHPPCTCGGVIQKMTWNQHLYFNIFFLLLSISGLLIENKSKNLLATTKLAK